MKISRRDKNLLLVFAIVCILFCYFYFIFTGQRDDVNEKVSKRDALETEYNTAKSEIETLETRKTQVNELTAQAVDKASGFYPKILQYKLTSEINKLLVDNKISGSIAFNEREIKGVEDLTPKTTIEGSTTFKPYVDTVKDPDNSNSNNISNNVTANNTVENDASSSTDVNLTAQTCEQMKAVISFTGTDEAMMNFMKALEAYDRRIVISEFTARPKNATEIIGAMKLEFFAIPKVTDIDNEYSNWAYDKVFGKALLFSPEAATGAVNDESNTGDKNDFVAAIKSSKSDSSTFKMGRANDNTKSTYIYEESNDTINVEVEFTEVGGKFYYKYKSGNSTKPGNGNQNGTEFNPKTSDINLQVFSEARIGDDDKSGVEFKIINNTSKPVNIIVSDDDKSNPRVKVNSEGSGVVNVK
ncbi:MAG: hypothetical protein GX275_08495 [Clostridiales bacterium]|nr:hypothetical protein [Clostridiales bacterium]